MALTITLKRPDQRESALRVEFMKNGTRFTFYTGITLPTEHWLGASQKVSSKVHNHKELNDYLFVWKKELIRIMTSMEAKQIRLDAEQVRKELNKVMNRDVKPAMQRGAETAPDDFVSFMDAYIRSKKVKAREVQKLQQTRKLVILANNLTTKKTASEWEGLSIKEKSRSELKAHYKLPFEKIDLGFIEHFRDYLYTATYRTTIKGVVFEQRYKVNTIDKQVKGLKQLILAAIEKKLVGHFTWSSIKAENIEVDSVYTDFEEISAIYSAPVTGQAEKLVRDKYILNCFLGMRYSDLNKLEEHLFKKTNIQGRDFVVYCGRNQKTDKRVEFALHPTAVEILERYNYKIPKLNSTEFNETIKVVCRKAGLTRLERIREVRGGDTLIRDVPKCDLLSSHAGRRSFCTNFYNEGVSIGAIMSISGHSTEKEFRKYIKKASVRIEVVAQQVLAIPGLRPNLRIA